MRALLKVAALAAAVSLLAGCSAGASASGKTEITWWKLTESSPTANATIKEIVSDFEKANPSITVKVQERAVDGHKDALRTALGTSGAPDIFFSWAGVGIGGEFVKNKTSLDLKKYYDKYDWKSRFPASALSTVTQYGAYDGVPYTQRGEAVFYNKTLFAKAGITAPPTTYEELVADADKLKASGVAPIEFGGTVNWHVMRLLDNLVETECGAKTFDALVTKKASWSSESCVTEAYKQLATWSKDYLNPGFASINNDESGALFYSGKAAMALEGDWFNQVIRDNKMNQDDVGIFEFPTGTGRLYGFNENNYITANSKHPDESAKFLDFLTSAPEQAKFIKAFGSQSVNTSVKAASGQSALDASWAPIFANSKGLYMNNDQNLSLPETTEYWRIQNAVATGDINAKEAAGQFQKFIDQE